MPFIILWPLLLHMSVFLKDWYFYCFNTKLLKQLRIKLNSLLPPLSNMKVFCSPLKVSSCSLVDFVSLKFYYYYPFPSCHKLILLQNQKENAPKHHHHFLSTMVGWRLHVYCIVWTIATAQPQPQPNSTSTRVGSDSVISWTTQPTRPHKLNF